MLELISCIKRTLVSSKEAISVLEPFKFGINRLNSLQLYLMRSLFFYYLKYTDIISILVNL